MTYCGGIKMPSLYQTGWGIPLYSVHQEPKHLVCFPDLEARDLCEAFWCRVLVAQESTLFIA